MKTRHLFALATLALSPAAAMAGGMDCYIGEVAYFPYNFTPKGYLPANGATLPINSYQALFSLYGTQFGGDGYRNFNLPKIPPLEANGVQINAGVCVNGIYPTRPY